MTAENQFALAVVGTESSVTLFRAIGAETFPVYGAEEAQEVITNLMNTYKDEATQTCKYAVVFVEDNIYKGLSDDLIERLAKRSLPALIPLPSPSSSDDDFSKKRLSKIVERAIGSDILS